MGASYSRYRAVAKEPSDDSQFDPGCGALAWNRIIAGTDAHAKNCSLLLAAGGQIRLAPLYDIASALPRAATPVGCLDVDLEETERKLRAEIESIDAEIAKLTKPPEAGSTIGFGKRIGEGTSEAIDRFTAVGVANDLQAIKGRMERALEKLAEGTYGTCDSCGATIPEGRLGAAPASVQCIACATRAQR